MVGQHLMLGDDAIFRKQLAVRYDMEYVNAANAALRFEIQLQMGKYWYIGLIYI